MAEDLSPGLGETVRALAAERGGCPPAEALVEYHELGAAERASHSIDAHVQICSRCQLVLLHLDEPAPAVRDFRWHWAAAAAVALLAAGPLVYRSVRPSPEPDTIRGAEIQAVSPSGDVTGVAEFAWQSPVRAARYRVTVYRGSEKVWTGTSGGTSLRPDAPLPLLPDADYRWVVEALDRDGEVRMSSPPQPFRLLSKAPTSSK